MKIHQPTILRRHLLAAIGTATVVLSTHTALAQSTGSISGSILDASGPIKSAVRVTAVRTSLPPARATALTDANGTFLLKEVPPGNYQICVHAPNGSYLDPCQWSLPGASRQQEAVVRAGQAASGIQVTLEAASKLQIQLNDPGELLDPKRPDRDVTVGVFTPEGLFYPAAVRSGDSKSRIHEIAVPFDRPLKVHVSSAKLSLADGQGTAVGTSGKTLSVTSVKGGPAPGPIAYTVTGIK